MNNKTAERLNMERNRAQLRIRLSEGLQQLGIRPWKNILVVILLVLLAKPFDFIMIKRSLPVDSIIPQQYFGAYDNIKIGLIILVFLMLLVGLIYLIGIPRRDRKISSSLMAKFSAEDFKNAYYPILMSSRAVKGTDTVRLEFFSPYISLGIWQTTQLRSNIPAGWGYHLEGEIQNGGRDGNNTRRIVMYVAPGAKPTNKSAQIDPFFR